MIKSFSDLSKLAAGPGEDPEERAFEDKKKAAQKAALRSFVIKHKIKLGSVLAAIVLLFGFLWYGSQPLKGPAYVGLCRAFVELQLNYPETMRLMQYEYFDRGHRLFYTYTDPFGEYRSSMAECKFSVTPYGSLIADSIKIDRRDVDLKKREEFNKTIPIIMAYGPNMIVPFPPKGSLEELKID